MKKKGLKSRPLARKTAREYRPPREKGPKSPVFRWGFMLFVAAWMFVLGILVGRYATPVDFDPNRIENELAELRAAEIQKEKERLKAEAKALYDMDLDFYEDLKNPGRALGLPASDPVVESQPSFPEIKRAQSTKHSAPARQDRKIVSPARPKTQVSAAAPKPSRPKPAVSKPAAPAPAVPKNQTGGYAIQVASFAAAPDADRMVARLKGQGYAGVYRTEDHVAGIGIRYRVRVGQFKDSTSARGVLTRLRNTDNFQDAYILRNK